MLKTGLYFKDKCMGGILKHLTGIEGSFKFKVYIVAAIYNNRVAYPNLIVMR